MTLGSVVPFAGELFNHAAWWFMLLMIRISEWAAQLPGACVHVGTPSLVVFVLYYAVLISVMTGGLFKPRHRVWVSTVIALLGFATIWEWRVQRSAAHLTLLPLNGGEVVYFKPAHGGKDLLIDCGDESAAEFALKPFLRGQGVNHPSTLLLTHGDVHNAGGAALVHERFSPEEVLVSSTQFRSTAYRDAMRGFEAKPGLLRRVQRGERIGPWTVLHPSAGDRFPQADDNAIVLHGVPTQGEPLADALLAALHPALIVVTDSEYPALQRASAKLRTRLEASGFAVCYTHQVGAVSLTFKEGKWSMTSMQGERQSGGAAQ